MNVSNNDVITFQKTGDKFFVRLLREAITDQDVKMCIDVFQELLSEQDNRKFRVLIDCRSVDINVVCIKWSVVNLIKTHFQENIKAYLRHVAKCVVVVNNELLSSVFQKIIDVIIKDKNLILVTHTLSQAHTFLK